MDKLLETVQTWTGIDLKDWDGSGIPEWILLLACFLTGLFCVTAWAAWSFTNSY